jgi:predicted PurR-regulated permease PerM
MEKVGFEFSWETIFRLGFLAVSLYALYQLKEILLWVIFALVISLLFRPLIEFLQEKKVPRTLATIFVYSAVFLLLAVSIYLFSPLLIIEANRFSEGFPQYFEKVSPFLRDLGLQGFESIENFVDLAQTTLSRIGQSIFSALFSIFGGIFTTIFIIFLSFFLSLEERAFERSLSLLFPTEFEDLALNLWRRCQNKVSAWFLTRVASSLFVGILTYLALLILGSEFSFSLGVLAGISNFIPIVGPFVVGFFIFILILLTSPLKAGLAVIIFMLIHQIEGNLLLPVLSKKFIGLSPSLVLISLVVGGELGGIWGAILGVPLLGILLEFMRDFLKKKKEVSELQTED